MKEISELLDLLNLEQIEENLFRGYSKTVGSTNVFGGQVLAQALSAAINTVPEDRHVHSLHSYFILPGNLNIPIIFQVDRIRDGGSFTTRRVKAIQQGREIFLMSAFLTVLDNVSKSVKSFSSINMPTCRASIADFLPLVTKVL